MKLVELYDGNLFECQMIKNLLENKAIYAHLKDEIMGSRGFGFRPAGGVKLVVSDDDYERARKIVMQFEETRKKQ